MTLDRSYIGYLGFLGIDLFKSVLMYSNGAICLIKLLFKMGLFTVYLLANALEYPALAEHFLFRQICQFTGVNPNTTPPPRYLGMLFPQGRPRENQKIPRYLGL
jgi:hypothetical protein